MADLMSMQSGLLTEDQLKQKRSRERIAFIGGILAQFVWASNSIQLKTYKKFFPIAFSNNSIMFLRSLPIWVLGYILARRKGISIPSFNQIEHFYWFICRSFGNYFSVILYVMMLDYFRVSTCMCIMGCQPVLIIILSIFILNEKFYSRYLCGVLLCIGGTAIIVLNENTPSKSKDHANSDNKPIEIEQFGNIFIGIVLAIINLIVSSFSTIGLKVLCRDKMSVEVQNYYIGMFNSLPGLFMCFVEFHFGFSNFLYVIYALSNGFVFYMGNYCNTMALNDMPLSKYIPMTYLLTVFTFILGFTILREPVFFTDIIGSLIILSFQLYNVWVPLKKQY